MNAAAANVQDKLQILSAQMRALQAQVCDLILAQKTPQENVQHSVSDLHAVVRELLTEERAILRRDIEKHVTAAVNRTSSSPSGAPSTVAASIFEEHVMPKLDAWLRETEYKITDRVSRNLRYEIDFILRTREKERLLRGDDEVMGAKPGLIVATDMPAPSSSTHRTSIAVDGPSRATATPSHKVEGISWQDDADLKKSNLQLHRELNEFKSRLDSRAHDLAGMRRSSMG